jgi:UDP-N-acetylglucosamine/UDP-N-acetylgalactosamine diphosphorylase
MMPAFSKDGRILLSERHRMALSPDGHGGTLTALRRSGALAEMADDGIEHVSYFQVDNPLVRPLDPLFIGLHAITGSEMSSKAVRKTDPAEKVGVFAMAGGALRVIEYSDLPAKDAAGRRPDGSLRLEAGSIAIHVIALGLIERLSEARSGVSLPWHRAEKKVPFVELASGRVIEPAAPNAVKLERFIFDAVPLAVGPIVLMTERAEEFSPVKNADGPDSPATARRHMVRAAARRVEACGVGVPRRPDGEADCVIEISPLVGDDLPAALARMGLAGAIPRGGEIYIS